VVSIQQFLTEGIKNLEKVSIEFAKDPTKFAEFVAGIRRETNKLELDFIAEYLEARDQDIVNDGRRKARWYVVRKDEKQLITSLGTVRFHKTLFKHKETGEYAYLLDRVLHLGDHERMTEDAVARALTEAVQSSYRKGGEEACLNEEGVSKQTVKTLIHCLEFPQEPKPVERKQVKHLYIDADEDHLSLQFNEHRGDIERVEGRKTNTLLSKLVYVYEGIEPEAPKSKRWRLVNPHYFSGVYQGDENKKLWKEVADYIESHYDTDAIKKIYLNGDGAGWIKSGKDHLSKAMIVTDEFHIQKYLMKMTNFLLDSAGDARTDLLKIIREGKKADLREYCDKLRHYAETAGDHKRIDEGERYILSNWSGAKERLCNRRYVKGCSAEAHVEHVLSRRMSSDPMGWSRKGADRMSHLRAYVLNGGDILSLVRYQEKKETKKAAGAEELPILLSAQIIRSERGRVSESLKYVERMQATLSPQAKAKVYFHEQIRV